MPLKGKAPKGKGNKRSLGGADPGQKTLVAMFAAGVAAKRPKPVRTLEEENAIVENFAQDLDNVFGHYMDSIAHLEQLQRLSDEKERKDRRLSRDAQRDGRRSSRGDRRDSLGLNDFELTPDQARAMETSADEFGDKFVCMLRALIQRGSGCPSRTCQKQLAVIISNHNAHKTPLLSAQAADTLAQLNRMYPSVSVEDGQDGKPTLAKSTGTWEPRLIGEVARWRAGQWRPDTAADRRGVLKPLDHWDIFVQFTSWACESLGRGGPSSEGSRGLSRQQQQQQQQEGGGLLMLEQAVEALLADFSCRMQVFAAHCEPGGGGKSRRPTDLLRGSFLGELLEAGEDVHRSMTAADLVNNLVFIIGSEAADADAVDADDDEEPHPALVSPARSSRQRQGNQQQQQQRPAVVARHRLREAARGLLKGILEYYGSLEDTGCFNKFHGRAFRSNLRVAMDLRMLVAFQNELQSTEEKAAFLSSLAPRDRVRFIGSVVARLRAKRVKDKDRYPQVVRVEQIYDSQSQEVNEYIDIDCLEVLRYIADDHKYAEKIKGIEGRDSLAMMVSQLIQGAADMAAHGPRSGDALLKLEEASERAVSVLMNSEPRTLDVAARVHLASVSLRLARQG